MRMRSFWALTVVMVLATSAFAQENKPPAMSAEDQKAMEAFMKASTPGAAHKGLADFEGTWNTSLKTWMKPGDAPFESTGISTNTFVLGGRWVEQRYSGTFMGMPFNGIGYTGYDNLAKKYVGTWMDDMSTSVLVSSGSLSSDKKSMNFTSTMIDPMTEKSMKVKEKIIIHGKDHHVMEMWTAGPDGKQYKMMELDYKRKK